MHIHDWRLAVITANAANLANQLMELNQLRDRVRKAELLTQRPRRIGIRKKSEDCEIRRPLQLPASFITEDSAMSLVGAQSRPDIPPG